MYAKFWVYGQMSHLFIGKSQKLHICNKFGGEIAPKMYVQDFSILFWVG